MTSTSHIPEPIAALTPELFDRLKDQIQGTLSSIISKNRNTRFVHESSVLGGFRNALGACAEDDVNTLRESFHTTVPFTSYDDYLPFISKFTDKCKLEDVKDMFSPGLPWFIAITSSTSSKYPKLFAKYLHPKSASSKAVDDGANPVSDNGGTNCIIYSLRYREAFDILDEKGATASRIPVTLMSSGSIRMQHGVNIEKDPYIMNVTAPRSAPPVAVCFIQNYRAFLLMNILFALADEKLAIINSMYGTMFVDMVDYMEEEWDTLVDSIETGVIPDYEGLSEVRQYLEPKFKANPERAANLRSIGKTPEHDGWLQRLWPMLQVVIGVASGVFSAVVPKMRRYLGPNVRMRTLGFTASEAYVGTLYNPEDLNIFKVALDDILEYLDVTKAVTLSNLTAAHDVEVGRRYEVVVTTRDGLWRYRLGDVVEIAGFDPTDGTPLIRYIERRNVGLDIAETRVTEKQIVDSVFAAQESVGPIAEFTVVVDDQKPALLHILIEIEGELLPSADEAPSRIEAALYRLNDTLGTGDSKIARPMVHVVKRGTFKDYRRMRIQLITTGTGQVKVPVVMTDKDMQAWMFQRVDRVFGA